MTIGQFMKTFAAVALGASACMASAQSTCTGTNDNDDAHCSISCPAGQAAVCLNGAGSNLPNCSCASNISYDQQKQVLTGQLQKQTKAIRVKHAPSKAAVPKGAASQ
jgi:hypothetical protein